jgi:DNA invertase Pin-like site-specific DNA recombinase
MKTQQTRTERIAVYTRVSSKAQDVRSQELELAPYRQNQRLRGNVVTDYMDKFTGKSMNRPGWNRLWADVEAGKIDRITIWRLDRLGRTVSGLSKLFEELMAKGITLESIRDKLDLATSSGRLVAHVLASVAQFETEVRAERIVNGIAATKAEVKAGKRAYFKSGPPDRTKTRKLTPDRLALIREQAARGKSVSAIAKLVGLSRPTIAAALDRWPFLRKEASDEDTVTE